MRANRFEHGLAAMNFSEIFSAAMRVVRGDCFWYDHKHERHVQTYEGREWFQRECNAHDYHPAVLDALRIARPHDWHLLLLEFPHKSVTDPNRLAYTENERKGEADRQTVTTIGKYLTRHFGGILFDHEIRDIVARHTYAGQITITSNLDNMIKAVIIGPSSCMSKRFDICCDDGVHRHPYAVYDPSLGWSMAVRHGDNGEVLGRCLLWTEPDEAEPMRVFVRSYKRNPNERSHSGVDESIEAWLKSQGYTKRGGWPSGAKLMRYDVGSGYLMPYIDGDTQSVDPYNQQYMEIGDCADIQANNTDGTAGGCRSTCEDCGANIYSEDDEYFVGRHDDRLVCESCCENDYTYSYGRRGYQYRVHNDSVIEADGEYYDADYLDDNSIVELENGEYTHQDNAVFIESENEWYHCDDERLCYAEDTEQHELMSNCWQCHATDDWYTDAVDYVEIDGETYHPDNAPANEPNE